MITLLSWFFSARGEWPAVAGQAGRSVTVGIPDFFAAQKDTATSQL